MAAETCIIELRHRMNEMKNVNIYFLKRLIAFRPGPKLWPNLDKDKAEDSPSAGGLKCPEIEAKPSVVWVQIKIKTFLAVKPLQTKLDKAKSHLYLLHRVNMLKAYSS